MVGNSFSCRPLYALPAGRFTIAVLLMSLFVFGNVRHAMEGLSSSSPIQTAFDIRPPDEGEHKNSINSVGKKELPARFREGKGGMLVFYHVAKTGGTTVRSLFQKYDMCQPTVRYWRYTNPPIRTVHAREGARPNGTCVPPGAEENLMQTECQNFLAELREDPASPRGVRKSKRTILWEIHGGSPGLEALAPCLKQLRAASRARGTPFFAFTLVREPTAFSMSYFKYYHVNCLRGWCEQRQYWYGEGAMTFLTEHDVVSSVRLHPNQQCFLLKHASGTNGMHPSFYDTCRVTRDECEGVYETMKESLDWIGTTERLSFDTVPLLEYLLDYRCDGGGGASEQQGYVGESVKEVHANNNNTILVENKTPHKLPFEDSLSNRTISNLSNITSLDRAMFDRVRSDYVLSDLFPGIPPEELENKNSNNNNLQSHVAKKEPPTRLSPIQSLRPHSTLFDVRPPGELENENSNTNNLQSSAGKKELPARFQKGKGGMLVFYHVAKTGGTTVRRLLKDKATGRPGVQYVKYRNPQLREEHAQDGARFNGTCVHPGADENKMQRECQNFLAKLRDGNKMQRECQAFLVKVREHSSALYSWQRCIQKVNKTYLWEIHGGSPGLVALAPCLKQLRDANRVRGTPFFAFTLVREPTSFSVSYFKFYHANCPKSWCEQRQYLHGEGAMTLTTERDVVASVRSHPNQQCFLLKHMSAVEGMHPSYYDKCRVTREECEGVYETMKESLDWIGTTERLSFDTMPLLDYLLDVGEAEVVRWKKAGNTTNEEAHTNNNKTTLVKNKMIKLPFEESLSNSMMSNLSNVTSFDRAIFDRVRSDYVLNDLFPGIT